MLWVTLEFPSVHLPYSAATLGVEDQTNNQPAECKSGKSSAWDRQCHTHKDQELRQKSISGSFRRKPGIVACMLVHPPATVSNGNSKTTEVLTASPTMPIAYPADTPARPTESPAARCMDPLSRHISITQQSRQSAQLNIRI